MFTLLFKTILALFPFIREIVNSHQQGPRDRRTKNPLTPWLVISLVYILASNTSAGTYIIQLLDKEQHYTLENTKLAHQVSMADDVKNENLELKKQLRTTRDDLVQATDDRDVLKQHNDDLRDDNNKLSSRVDELVAKNTELGTEVTKLTERLILVEKTNKEKTTPKPVQAPPAVRTNNGHTRRLVDELMH